MVGRLKDKSVLLTGSASFSVEPGKLAVAHDFVSKITRTLLEQGAGIVVYGGNEPVNREGVPLIFDWNILRVAEAFASDSSKPVTGRVVVVTSNKARLHKMSDEHRALLGRLCAHGMAELVIIPDNVHTGGNIGDEQTRRADAMVAIGGGKGVADRAWKLQRRGGAVILPMDIQIGSYNNDGDGAVGLHKAMLEQPQRFFPYSAQSIIDRILSLSLEAPVMSIADVVQGAVDALGDEFDAASRNAPVDALVLTALPVELGAVLLVFDAIDQKPEKTESGTNYWFKALFTVNAAKKSLRVAIACFGNAGNVDAAAETAMLLTKFKPKIVVMVGIAAGMRGKCLLGEVVFSERVIAYEGAALVTGPDGPREVPRPESFRTPHATKQDVISYLANPAAVKGRLVIARKAAGIVIPPNVDEALVDQEFVPRLATFASGEKLLRDPGKFRTIRHSLHGKIEVIEIEAAGVATVCSRCNARFLVIRGISDFGDEQKNDRFQEIAAQNAAIVARDFLEQLT